MDKNQDQFLAVAQCDVVEWPRNSQAIRLEQEQATHSYHVMDINGQERGIFYTKEAAVRFCERTGYYTIEVRKILSLF